MNACWNFLWIFVFIFVCSSVFELAWLLWMSLIFLQAEVTRGAYSDAARVCLVFMFIFTNSWLQNDQTFLNVLVMIYYFEIDMSPQNRIFGGIIIIIDLSVCLSLTLAIKYHPFHNGLSYLAFVSVCIGEKTVRWYQNVWIQELDNLLLTFQNTALSCRPGGIGCCSTNTSWVLAEIVLIGCLVKMFQHFYRFLALLAKGQKGLCRGDLSVRPSVRKQFLVNTIQSSLLIVSQPNLYSS